MIRVLHVAGPLGGGLMSALHDYVESTPELDHHLAAWLSPDFTTGEQATERWSTVHDLSGGHLARIRAIKRVVRDLAPDVVHVHSSFPGAYVRSIPLGVAKHKIVYTPHAFAFERLDVNVITRAVFWTTEAALSFRTGHVAACSPHEADRARALPGRPAVTWVPNVARTSLPPRREPTPGRPLVAVAVGRTTAQKQPEFFAEAVRVAKRRSLAIDWVWIGGGDDAVDRSLRASGAEVTGWLARDAALDRLAQADVYVHTAGWEGMPITVLEAAAGGLPIVARRTPVFEAVGLAPLADTPDDIVDLVAQHPDGPDFRRAVSTSARIAETHTVAAQRDALLAVYDSVAPRQPSLV